MVLLQAGSVQARFCYFKLVLDSRGSCQTNPWFFDPLQTGLTEHLSMSWVSLHYPCGKNKGHELCWGVPEATIKIWQNSLHGISMMKPGLPACEFSHMQNMYHLLGDLFAILQIHLRCSLYSCLHVRGGFIYRPEFPAACEACSRSICLGCLALVISSTNINPPINCKNMLHQHSISGRLTGWFSNSSPPSITSTYFQYFI